MGSTSVTPRQKQILKAIVEDYIFTAEPVGSRVLSKKFDFGLSPATLRNEMADLEDEGLPMVEIPQSAERMVPACRLGYELLVDRRLLHDDDVETTAQVKAAVPREADGGWRLSKGKSGEKIDAAVALCMAAYVLEMVDLEGDPADDVW